MASEAMATTAEADAAWRAYFDASEDVTLPNGDVRTAFSISARRMC